MPNPPGPVPQTDAPAAHDAAGGSDDAIDFSELGRRLRGGLPLTAGLLLIGLVAGALFSLQVSYRQPVTTQTRVAFSFAGFERGEYPDKSKFQAEDLAAPAVVGEAIRRAGLENTSAFQTRIRAALNIEPLIPASIVKERDRLRAAGQTVGIYMPDEYALTLSLPRTVGLSDRQRHHLLSELVSVYRANFNKTFGEAPLAFGTAFETVRSADFTEYELIFNAEMDQMRTYLTQQIENAKSFRSPSTNLSFQDLLEQTNLFAQIQLNEVLGLIHENGLSRNRLTARMKMNYYLRQLEEREKHALDDEKVVRDLLDQAQARAQNVVLGVKSQAAQPRSEAPLLDQGLIESLIQNDAYNLLVRKTLEAGLKVKAIQAEKNRLLNLRDNLLSFIQSDQSDQTIVTAQVERSIKDLRANYDKLVADMRKTHIDFANQQFADAVRFADSIHTDNVARPMIMAAVAGALLGVALGAALSLFGIRLRSAR